MARARVPARFAIALLLLRIVATVLSTLVIVFLLYMTIMFGKTFPWSYTAAAIAICLDTVEAAPLADKARSVPRLHWPVVFGLEMLVLGLHVGGCLTLAFAELAEAPDAHGFYSADPYRTYALGTQAAVFALHFILIVMGCIEQVLFRRSFASFAGRLEQMQPSRGLGPT